MNCRLLVLTLFMCCVLSKTTTKDELISSLNTIYRRQALIYHPDKSQYDKSTSNILFSELTNMFEKIKKHIEDTVQNDPSTRNDCTNMRRTFEKKYDSLVKEYNQVLDKYNNENNHWRKQYDNLFKEYSQLIDKYNQIVLQRESDISFYSNQINYLNNLLFRYL